MIEARRVLDDAAREVDRLNERIQRQWATARDRRLRAACQDMDLVTEFFAGTLRGELEPFTTFVRADAPYVERVQEVHDLVVELVAALEAIDTTPDDEERRALVDNLRQVAIRLRAGLRSTVDAYAAVVNAHSGNGAPDEPRYAALQFVADLRTQLRTRELIDGAERARAEWQILAGDRSAKTTADHYRLHADAERKRADLLRGVVAFLVVVITAGAVALSLWREPASLGAEVLRLSVTFPFAVLAAYLARESTRHRGEANRAKELAMAMETVAAYAEPLGDRGTELRVALGMRVYSRPPEAEPDDATDGLALVEPVEEFARRLRAVFDRKQPAP